MPEQSKNRKLVFLACVPVSRIFGEKVDPYWYQQQGFDVEFWDLSSLFFARERIVGYMSGADSFAYVPPARRVFQHRKEVATAVQSLPPDAVVYHLSRISGPCVDDYWLLRL